MSTINYGTDGTLARRRATFSIPSVLAIICALGSFFVGPGVGLLLCILAIVFGIVGGVLALMPGTRGGIISILSIVLAAIGVIVALIRLLAPGPADPVVTPGASPYATPPAIVRVA